MDNQQPQDSGQQSPQQAATPSKAPLMYIVIIVLVVLAGGIFIARQKASAPKTNSAMEEGAEDADEVGDVDKVDGEEGDKMEKDEGKEEGDEEKYKEDKAGASGEENAKTAEFEVEGGEFYYKPNILKVKKGQTVEIEFNNKDGFHDFVIDEFNVKTKQLKSGEKADIEFVAGKTGKFEFYCSVGQHRAKGMKGTLIVE